MTRRELQSRNRRLSVVIAVVALAVLIFFTRDRHQDSTQTTPVKDSAARPSETSTGGALVRPSGHVPLPPETIHSSLSSAPSSAAAMDNRPGAAIGMYSSQALSLPPDLPEDMVRALTNPPPPVPQDILDQLKAPPPELPPDLKAQLAAPPPPLPPDMQRQMEGPPPPMPPDIQRALETPPALVTIDEVNRAASSGNGVSSQSFSSAPVIEENP